MSERAGKSVTWGARILAGLIRAYQLVLSPWVTQQCKYYPSCSQYALDAVRTHGAVRGAGLAVWRLLRCNPWSRGGVDHVPPARGVVPAEPTIASDGGDEHATDLPAHHLTCDDTHLDPVRRPAELART